MDPARDGDQPIRPLRLVLHASMDEPKVTPLDLVRHYPRTASWLLTTWGAALIALAL